VQAEEEKVLFELTNETRNKVHQVQFVPVTESDNGIIKYSLEEYMELRMILSAQSQ
jgi:hypothetical protein